MLIFRGVTILSEGSNFKSLRSRSAHASHLSLAITYMSWSTVPVEILKRNWTHFPLTKLFLSRNKKHKTTWPSQNHRKKQNPLQPYLQPTKTQTNWSLLTIPTTNPDSTAPLGSHPPWCCSKQKNQILRSCASANRSERFENSKNFRAKMPPKMDIFFSGQITGKFLQRWAQKPVRKLGCSTVTH